MITTIGAMMVNDALPEDLRKSGRVIDSGGLKKILAEVGEKHPEHYGQIVNTLKQIGNDAAYHSGTSFHLEDFAPNTEIRDRALAAHKKELDELIKRHAHDSNAQLMPSFQRKKMELYGKVEDQVSGELKTHVRVNRNALTDWHVAGARGKEADVRQINTMVGRQLDVTNMLVPEMSLRSFSEGLSPVDFLVHASGARKGVVATYTSVQEPGAFAKTMFAAASDMLISAADCGTKRGRDLSTEGRDALDRCLAEDVPGVAHRNDVVSSSTLEAARKHGIKTLKVRSPLYCQQPEGVCSMCYGLSETGRLPHIGEHVGIKAAQSLSEPLTQLALNNKHAGGTVGKRSPLAQITQFMDARKVMDGTAVLSLLDGHVTAINPAPGGLGHDVWVDGQRHFIHKSTPLLVKAGDHVKRGQMLSDGQINPVEAVSYMGMDKGREYFADEARRLYDSNGIKGHGKVFETMARTVMNLGRVHHAGDRLDLVPGDVVKWSAVGHMMDTPHTETVSLDKAEGRILAHPVGLLGSFSVVTRKDQKRLIAAHGANHQVTVFHPSQPVIEPLVLGVERAAMHKGDWMANLGFKHTKETFQANAATFATSDIHGFNPLSAYAHGAEFGSSHSGDGRF